MITIECNECLETLYLPKNFPVTSTPFSGMYFLLNYLSSAGPVACIHRLSICPMKLLGQFGGVRERESKDFVPVIIPGKDPACSFLKGTMDSARETPWTLIITFSG